MAVKYHADVIQGSDEWKAIRCGLLTASEMKNIITPAKLQYAQNDKSRAHLYELLAQRITQFVEPHFVNDDMLRGQEDEIEARALYSKHYAAAETTGFITNDKWGFTLGYSPDGLVGADGLIEVKSRRQKYQIETIIAGVIPDEFMLQAQTGLLVSERKWLDFISYCGGAPMLVVRVLPDDAVQSAIIDAAEKFHKQLDWQLGLYQTRLADKANRLIPTERRIEQEIFT